MVCIYIYTHSITFDSFIKAHSPSNFKGFSPWRHCHLVTPRPRTPPCPDYCCTVFPCMWKTLSSWNHSFVLISFQARCCSLMFFALPYEIYIYIDIDMYKYIYIYIERYRYRYRDVCSTFSFLSDILAQILTLSQTHCSSEPQRFRTHAQELHVRSACCCQTSQSSPMGHWCEPQELAHQMAIASVAWICGSSWGFVGMVIGRMA